MSRERILSLALAVGLSLGVYVWISLGPEEALKPSEEATSELAASAETQAAAPLRVVARTSSAKELPDMLTLRGVTEAARKIDIRAQTDGLVISPPRRKGAKVKVGDTLCELEQGDRAPRLSQAEAKLAQAIADSEASAQLSQKGFRAQTQLAADAAALATAEADVAKMKLDIERTKIRAPFSGVLESDTAELGALLQPGDICATVLSLDPIKLVGYAPERGITSGLRVGEPAAAKLVNGEIIHAEVSFVARAADPETRTFRIEATADNPKETLRDGQTVEIAIPLAAASAHQLPHSALVLDDSGRLGVRLVRRDDASGAARAAFAPVEILKDDADGVWLGGLGEQAEVILVGQDYVTDGDAVTVASEQKANQ
ncbi:MAG: efflux RND transporter periplasmic adaptor subunit [Rhodobacteraceae bacterium]|nr:efflux RND transporter periplasmic adaptor subunit [Paracoccaceae bacterium]